MRVAVIGAGGVGSAVAAFLARAGRDVVLVGRSHEHIDAINTDGLRVDEPDGAGFIARPQATHDLGAVAPGSVDVLIVLTKTFDSAHAVEGAAPMLAHGGIGVSLQNGLGNEAALVQSFGSARSLIGVTTIGAQRHEPGRITVTGVTAANRTLTQFGFPRSAPASLPADARTSPPSMAGAVLAAELSAAGLPATFSRDVEADIWAKLALAVMGPVSAVMRRSVVHIWAQPDARLLVRDMFDEVLAVAAAEGVELDRDASWAHAMRTYEGTGDHTPSMCADVLAHRRTEIDAMAGEVARRGRLRGIPTPVHDTIVRAVRTIEATYRAAR